MRFYLAILCAVSVLLAPFPTARSFMDVPAIPQRASVLGYEREAFGSGWGATAGGCTTRSTALAQAFSAANCQVSYSEWKPPAAQSIADPYTGLALRPQDAELDHLYPLSAAWDMGAYSWDRDKRVAFANDPNNLVVTSTKANQAKSDGLPSQWMPPSWRARCAYVQQLTVIARTYELPLPRADKRAARRACSGLSGLFGRDELTHSSQPTRPSQSTRPSQPTHSSQPTRPSQTGQLR